MSDHNDEAAWAEELSAAIEDGVKALRWVAIAVVLYVIASIGAAMWVAS